MNKPGKTKPIEKGQALVLIILSIVAIFGFAALAVDMGQIFMARRSAQSAADAAALGAAYQSVTSSDNFAAIKTKALELAKLNGYNNDGATNQVVINNPPVDSPYCGICGDPRAAEYYQVRITVKMKPIFAHFVYGGKEWTTVEAVAHAKDVTTITGGDTLVALSSDSTALEFDGKTGVDISGGNIRSVGGMVKNGASGGIVVTNGKVYYGSTFAGHTSPFSPAKPEKNNAGEIMTFTPPWCPNGTEVNDGTWSNAGTFRQKKINGVNYYYYPSGLSVETLPAGIHCVEGGIGKGNYKGTGVLIVLLSGGIQQTGGDSIMFKAPLDIVDKNGNHFGGLMMYAPHTNNSVIQFGGNTEAYVQGTMYLPGAACKIGGNPSGTGYHTSIVCNDIKIHGNPVLKIIYKPEELYRLPPAVELSQ